MDNALDLEEMSTTQRLREVARFLAEVLLRHRLRNSRNPKIDRDLGENRLDGSLTNAIKSLDKGNEAAAENQIKAFINEVKAQSGKKMTRRTAARLNSLTPPRSSSPACWPQPDTSWSGVLEPSAGHAPGTQALTLLPDRTRLPAAVIR